VDLMLINPAQPVSVRPFRRRRNAAWRQRCLADFNQLFVAERPQKVHGCYTKILWPSTALGGLPRN